MLISKIETAINLDNSGSNTGEISCVANLISENSALFQKEGCNVRFELENDLLNITTDNCMHYGGIGVFFDGIYRNEENFQQIDYPLIKNGIFTTISEEIKFSELVGNDYELFKNSMHLVGEGNDVDRLGAKVFYGSIRGLFTLAESIIMYTETGEFWAAAIDNDIVKYFTNSPQYIRSLPKTIENWRERFLDKKVAFMN